MLLSIDGAAQGDAALARDGRTASAAALKAPARTACPSSYELDDAPAFERFFLVRAATPFSVATAVEAARALAAQPSARNQSLALPPGFEQISLALDKTHAAKKELHDHPKSASRPRRGVVPAVPGRRAAGGHRQRRGRRARARAAPTPTVRLRRFVLLAGVDDGGPTRTQLRYAATDARAMGRVLQTLGGVAPEDIVFVSTANRAAFDAAFADIEQRLRAGAQRRRAPRAARLLLGPLRRGRPAGGPRSRRLRRAARPRAARPRRSARRDPGFVRVGRVHAPQGRRASGRRS